MQNENAIDTACNVIRSGGIIAYPTESVFGLGCNPFNKSAVLKLLKLKKRPVEKGLIVIASHIQQVLPLISPKQPNDLARALKTWPGHYTWIFPKSKRVPDWVSGDFETIAVRVSKHPTVKKLCDALNEPLISTSANITNEPLLNSIKDIKNCFSDKIGVYIDEPVGTELHASSIIDAHTNTIVR